MYMLNVPPVAWALLPPPPLPPPPHADSIIAAAMPAATSAPLRFLNFTCNASLIPHRRGERTGRSEPRRGCRTTDWARAKRIRGADVSPIRRGGPQARPEKGGHGRHRVVT